jgi:divalent metal cation (Fe/Co/Zn/Cd) transporter
LIDPGRFGAADQVGSMLIGVIVICLSVQVLRRTVGQLLDTMPDSVRINEIRTIAMAVPGASGIEKCLARRSGLKYYVDLHLEVDPEMTVRESHDIATNVKDAIKHRLSWVADVLVHVEPADLWHRPIRPVPAGLKHSDGK